MTGLALVLAAALVVIAIQALLARRAEAAADRRHERDRRPVEPEAARPSIDRAGVDEAHDQEMDAVGQRTADVAHDINDLLAGIAGCAEVLMTRLGTAHPALQDATEIRDAALTGARLTRRLRALAGPGTATEAIDVNAVVTRTGEGLGVMLGGRVAVTLALAPGSLRVRACPGQLEEIVLNLALNAGASMPGGGRLTVSTLRYADPDGRPESPGEYARLVIADAGTSLQTAVRASRRDSILETGAESRAAGLAKVLAIVKQAGGRVDVDSVPGRGTMFTVDLPIADEAQGPIPPARRRGPTACLLVVEDEPHVREFVRMALTRAGHDVVAVAGPHEALGAMHRQPPIQLLLVDVVIPHMSGYDLAAQARLLVPGVRVVFMSGFACDESRRLPSDGFLPKPFDDASLHAAVEQALAG